MRLNTIYNEDCLEGMKRIPDGSIDMILCDLPYGTTACSWDTIIPFEPLWEQYERVIKDNGAIVLTASQPFTSALVMSNPKIFKYSWTWFKTKATNHLNSRRQPLRTFEDVLVFYKKQCTYNPQLRDKEKKNIRDPKKSYGKGKKGIYGKGNEDYVFNSGRDIPLEKGYPLDLIDIPQTGTFGSKRFHPTQKPVPLFEYLIKTYTNKGETVLDNCMGSGTTAIACLNTDRQYIGFELDETYHKLSLERIENHTQQLSLI